MSRLFCRPLRGVGEAYPYDTIEEFDSEVRCVYPSFFLNLNIQMQALKKPSQGIENALAPASEWRGFLCPQRPPDEMGREVYQRWCWVVQQTVAKIPPHPSTLKHMAGIGLKPGEGPTQSMELSLALGDSRGSVRAYVPFFKQMEEALRGCKEIPITRRRCKFSFSMFGGLGIFFLFIFFLFLFWPKMGLAMQIPIIHISMPPPPACLAHLLGRFLHWRRFPLCLEGASLVCLLTRFCLPDRCLRSHGSFDGKEAGVTLPRTHLSLPCRFDRLVHR